MTEPALNRLIECGAAQQAEAPYAAVIDLTEHQALTFDIGSATSAVLGNIQSLLTHPAARALISASISLGDGGTFLLQIATSSTVGFAAVGEQANRLFIRVRPKVPTQRLLELAQIAGRLPPWANNAQIGFDDISVLLSWTLRAFATSLDEVAGRGGFRSTHESVAEELKGKVRGKLLLPSFALNLSRGRPDRLPCRFPALRIDNEPNRLLRWAAHVALKLAADLPGLTDVEETIRRIILQMSGVTCVRPPNATVDREVNLPPNLRHYKSALHLARMLLRQTYLDAQAGHAAASGVALDMNDLYEAVFLKLLTELEPTAVPQPVWRLALLNAADGNLVKRLTIRPDIYVPETSARQAVVVDTKWKHAIARYPTDLLVLDQSEKLLVRPKTSDIYQAVTYALDFLRRGSVHGSCVAVLVYPALGDVPKIEHEISLEGYTISVCLVGWDVLRPPRESVKDVWSRLEVSHLNLTPTIPSGDNGGVLH